MSIQEAASNNYVDNKSNDSSLIKNTKHIDLNDRNITNARFIQVNQLPQSDSHLRAKLYVDKTVYDAIDEPSLLRLDPDEKLKQESIILNSTVTSPKTITELPIKKYINKQFNDPSIIKNTDRVDFKNNDLDNVTFFKVNRIPAFPEHLTEKIIVDNAISHSVDESSLLRLNPEEKLNLDEQDSLFLNTTLTSPKTKIEIPTKSYVGSLHESSRNRGDLSLVFNNQDNEFDKNKLTNLHSITVNRDTNLDNELSKKKYVDGSIVEGTLLKFNQTLENYLKVSVGNDTYNITKYRKTQKQIRRNLNFPV